MRVGIIMGRETSRRGTHLALRFGALAAVAVGAAACSSEAIRLSENPNASPYAAAPANQVVGAARPCRAHRAAAALSAATATSASHLRGDRHGPSHRRSLGLAGRDAGRRRPRRHDRRDRPPPQCSRPRDPACERAHLLRRTLQAGQRLVIPRYVADGGSAKLAHAALPRHPAPDRRRCGTGGAGRARRRLRRDAVLDRAKASHHHSRVVCRQQHDAGNAAQGRYEAHRSGPGGRGHQDRLLSFLLPRPRLTPVSAKPATLQSVKPGEQPVASARIAAPAAERDGRRARPCGCRRHADVPLAVARPGDHQFRRQDCGRRRATASTSPFPRAPPYVPPMTASSPMPATSSRATATSC